MNGEFWKNFGRLANKYGKMVVMIQKGRKSMYKLKNVQEMKVLQMELITHNNNNRHLTL